ARWPRPQSPAPGSGYGGPSADALHGLRWFLCRFRVCRFRADQWTPGRYLGPLVATMDHRRLDVSDRWHRPGKLVGLLRTRLGRLVVLGPGGERFLYAVAGRHRFDPLARGHRKARWV